MFLRGVSWAIVLTTCAGSAVVLAQESREEAIAREQEAKARQTKPYQPTKAERIIERIDEGLLQPSSGFFPYVESVYGGGGFSIGAGYRRFYADRSVWDIKGLYTIRNYKLVEVTTTTSGRRLDVGTTAGWRDATEVAYYGLGMDTARSDRSNFRFKQAYAGAAATLRPVEWSMIGGTVTYENYTLERGQGVAPSIETRYTPVTAPGLGKSPAFVHSSAVAGIDWRTSPGYSRTGGFYGVTVHDYRDVDKNLSFRRLDGNLVQHIPLLRENWVLSFRARAQTIFDGGNRVPYFLMPALGSSSTLRGYTSWRFRDRNSILTSGEFRWIPNRLGLDMAVFYDAGKVTDRREDLDLRRLRSDWGVGVRFHGPTVTVLRVDVAKGFEGWRIVFAGGPAF